MATDNQAKPGRLQLISLAFRDGSEIPPQYTCKGQNVSPPMNILNVPLGTESLTMIMHDPDAISGDYLHWLMWDIPPSTEFLKANSVPVGAIQGPNGLGKPGYTGPCPPKDTGTHHYIFDLYALGTTLDLPAKSGRDSVIKAMDGHVLAQASLTGVFAADS